MAAALNFHLLITSTFTFLDLTSTKIHKIYLIKCKPPLRREAGERETNFDLHKTPITMTKWSRTLD